MPTTIRVRSLPELLTILPHQLGFRPSTCVVLAGIGDRLGPIARVDLPPRGYEAVSYTHLDVYKRQVLMVINKGVGFRLITRACLLYTSRCV